MSGDVENKYVSEEVAKQLKNLGFKERVLTYFEDGIIKMHTQLTGWDFNTSFLTCVSRPTIQEAIEWFDKNTQLQGFVIPSIKENHFDWEVLNTDLDFMTPSQEYYTTRNEAYKKCLDEMIRQLSPMTMG